VSVIESGVAKTNIERDSKPVRFAVVGCGNIGTRHLAVLDAEERAEVVAFCDTDPTKLEKLADLYEGVAGYRSLDQMLEACDADVVTVCTPHYLHAEHALKVIATGRHVLVEKPMALTVDEADRMISAAGNARVLLMVVKQNRHNLPVAFTREALDSGRLGRILMVQCNVAWNRYEGYYRQSPWLGRTEYEGGALFTQVSHFMDLMIWMCGDVVDAGGQIETKNHQIDIEDCGTAWLRFANGAMGSLLWTTCAYNRNFEGSITLFGERGVVKIGGAYLNRIEHWDVEGFPLPEGIEWVDKPNSYGKYQGSSSNHDKVMRDVIRRVNREDFRVVSGEDGRRTVRAIQLIYGRCTAKVRTHVPTVADPRASPVAVPAS
jgi:UDP-N-acetyl-2-amino-2-deoxyglucuronate dehydrogenase